MMRRSFKTVELYTTLAILGMVVYALGPMKWGAVALSAVLGSYLWSRAICKMNTGNKYTSLKSVELYLYVVCQAFLAYSWYQSPEIKAQVDFLLFSGGSMILNQVNWNLSRSLVKHIVKVPNVMF